MRGQDMDRIFEKFWLRGGGEGYFADDERGWGATPSLVYGVGVAVRARRFKRRLKFVTQFTK